jgi:hypothetical protein
MDRPQIEDSDSDRVSPPIEISWTKKKTSAEGLFRQNVFDKAMEGYAAAAEAAIDQKAAPIDISKCYTNASQMAWRAYMIGARNSISEDDPIKFNFLFDFLKNRATLPKMQSDGISPGSREACICCALWHITTGSSTMI